MVFAVCVYSCLSTSEHPSGAFSEGLGMGAFIISQLAGKWNGVCGHTIILTNFHCSERLCGRYALDFTNESDMEDIFQTAVLGQFIISIR